MNPQQNPDRTSRQQIFEEARQALETFRRVMAEAGLTSESCLEALRRIEGAAAAEKAQREAADVLRLFHEQTARDAFHLSPASRPVSRRLASRRIV